jgi:Spy/CpxP family protein refolding chaperone
MRKLIPLVVAALMALALAAPALADAPPPGHHQQGGQGGYEGQPGNQN